MNAPFVFAADREFSDLGGRTLEKTPIWLVWILYSTALLLLTPKLLFDYPSGDPDDYLRLLQARDFVAGQSWFDVRQYRFDPPFGAEMHWSRLPDLPIAFFLKFYDIFLPLKAANMAAMATVPLLQLAVAMYLAAALVRALGGSQVLAKLSALRVPFFPSALINFWPGRIDHHGWQIICTLAAAMFLAKGGNRAAIGASIITALQCSISFDGLPIAALIAALLGLRFVLWGDRELPAFLLGLFVSSIGFFILNHPPSEYSTPHCDVMTWPHIAAFGLAFLTSASGMRVLPSRSWKLRLIALVPVPLISAALVFGTLGRCAINPLAGLDPVLEKYWFRQTLEGLSVFVQSPSTKVIVVWTLLVIAAGTWIALKQASSGEVKRKWVVQSLFAGGSWLISMEVMRFAAMAQILAIPLAALVIADWLPKARKMSSPAVRIIATIACLLCVSPAAGAGIVAPLSQLVMDGGTLKRVQTPTRAGHCRFEVLDRLPPSHMFTTLDLGPDLLVRTHHTAVASGHHRNAPKMKQVLEAFGGDPESAEAIVRGNHADYVLYCPYAADVGTARSRSPDNLASLLWRGQVPDWLDALPAGEFGDWKVYRVRPEKRVPPTPPPRAGGK